MKAKDKKPVGIRVLNSLCAVALLGSIIYSLVAGFEAMAIGVLALSLVGATAPVVASGEGFLEVLSGVFEALTEGIVSIFEAIADAIASLFG